MYIEQKVKKRRFAKANKEKSIILLKYVVRDSKKSRFMKVQEASRLLNNLELKTH